MKIEFSWARTARRFIACSNFKYLVIWVNCYLLTVDVKKIHYFYSYLIPNH